MAASPSAFLYQKAAATKQQAPHHVGGDVFLLGVGTDGFHNTQDVARLLMESTFTSKEMMVALLKGLVLSVSVDFGGYKQLIKLSEWDEESLNTRFSEADEDLYDATMLHLEAACIELNRPSDDAGLRRALYQCVQQLLVLIGT